MNEPDARRTKRLSEITRNEWIRYRWIDITSLGDSEPVLLRSLPRIPSDGAEAARDWDLWISSSGHAAIE